MAKDLEADPSVEKLQIFKVSIPETVWICEMVLRRSFGLNGFSI